MPACSLVSVSEGHRPLLVTRTKSSLASLRDTASPLLLHVIDPGHRLGPRASGETPKLDANLCESREGVATPEPLLQQAHLYQRVLYCWSPPLTLRPSVLPHLPTVFGKHKALGSNLQTQGAAGSSGFL